MSKAIDLYLYFNFRSPYCYLASSRMFEVFDQYHVNVIWRPLGGWHGRSDPDRAKIKMPIARQDVARWARRFGMPLTPPPKNHGPDPGGCRLPAGGKGRFAQALPGGGDAGGVVGRSGHRRYRGAAFGCRKCRTGP
ncbi:MAG: DsbA family protein [Marinobacter sp.]|nr:DsbA family protein [Marinobacter sp.]